MSRGFFVQVLVRVRVTVLVLVAGTPPSAGPKPDLDGYPNMPSTGTSTMLLPLLAAFLQGSAFPPKATAADTAYVTTLLDRAAATIRPTPSVEDTRATTLIEQVRIWRGDEAAWRLARILDESTPASDHYNKKRILASAIHQATPANVRDYFLQLTPNQRDSIIRHLPNFVGNVPSDVEAILESLITSPDARAEYMYRRAVAFRHNRNQVAALATLRSAIEAMRSGGNENYPADWSFELLILGEPVPVAILVEQVVREDPNTGQAARTSGISRIMYKLREVDAKRASAIADTLLTHHLGNDPSTYTGIVTAELMKIRGAPGDSTAAAAIRETIFSDRSRVERRKQDNDQALFQAVREHNATSLERALEQWRADEATAATLTSAATLLSSSLLRYSRADGPVMGDDREWGTSSFRRMWTASATLPAAGRDTVRVELVKVLARLDPIAALDSARTGLSTQPLRDRARAEALRQLVIVDVDLAEREASKLKDQVARDVAYGVLSATVLAGGRLKDAQRFAKEVSRSSNEWFYTRAALARTLAGRGARAEAITILRDILANVDPTPACSGCIYLNGEKPRPGPQLYRHSLIHIAKLALEHDMHADLAVWASAQASASQRVWAWLVIAQAMSFLKLGLFPNVPIHGQ